MRICPYMFEREPLLGMYNVNYYLCKLLFPYMFEREPLLGMYNVNMHMQVNNVKGVLHIRQTINENMSMYV